MTVELQSPPFKVLMQAKRPFTFNGGGLFVLALLCLMAGTARSAVTVRVLYQPNDAVHAMTVQAGVLYLGGDFTQLSDAGGTSTVARAHLAALDVASGLPLAWDPGANGPVYALGLSNGKIVAGGDFTVAAGLSRSSLVQLDAWPSTGVASAWAPQLGPMPRVFALACGPSTLYAGGVFSQAGGLARQGLAAVDASGSTGWTKAFNAGIAGGAGTVQALRLDGGTLYVGGDFSAAGGQSRSALAALDAGSGLATAFAPPSALAASPQVLALALDASRLYVGGTFSGSLGSAAALDLVALDRVSGLQVWNGAVDGPVNAILPMGDGRVAVGGVFATVQTAARRRFAALDAATGVVESGLSADLNSGLAKAYALQAFGSELILGGQFMTVAAVNVSQVAALSLPAYVAPTFTMTPGPATPTVTPTITPDPATPIAGPTALADGESFVFPNPLPCSQAGHWGLRAPLAGRLTWRLFNPRGSQVRSGEQAVPAGPLVLPFDCAGLSPGLYLLKAEITGPDASVSALPIFKVALAP